MSKYDAVCGCRVEVSTDYRGDMQRVEIMRECALHMPGATSAPAPLEPTFVQSFVEYIATIDPRRIDAEVFGRMMTGWFEMYRHKWL